MYTQHAMEPMGNNCRQMSEIHVLTFDFSRITWLLKEWLYRDASWETPCTLGSAVYLFVGMGLGFWINIVFLTLGDGSYDPSPFQLCMILTIYTLGIWLHHTADTQKYFVLRAKKGLITDGLFSMSRNPNYLGEMFIYGSFAGRACL